LPSGLPPKQPQDHKIELEPGAQPTVHTQWRLTQPELQEPRNQLDYLMAKGFIRPSTSPFAAPILNEKIALPNPTHGRTDRQPSRSLPIFRRSTFAAVTIKFGCSLTIATRPRFRIRYGELRIHGDAVWINERPLKRSNSPMNCGVPRSTRQMRDNLPGWILIYSKTQAQQLKDLEAVFQRLQQYRLITKGLQGASFLKQELEFLGHVISTEGIQINSQKSPGYSGVEIANKSAAAAIIFGLCELRAVVYTQHGRVNWTSSRPTSEGESL
ncbi:hypothetical protein CLOP_g8418, partial [Closterium sp. NIES-67]